MNKKYIIGGGLGLALLGGVVSITPIEEFDLVCNTTMVSDLYPTKSGEMEAGYYDPRFMNGVVKATATSSEKILTPISPIGTQKKANCKDQYGKTHTISIDDTEYSRHSVKGAKALEVKRSTTIFDKTI
jgi:hypothetical protein